MPDRYLIPWRIRWYSDSILFAIFLGFMICVCYGTESYTISVRLGGDYPAFYSIGRIVAKGNLEAIYNPENQDAEQKPLMGKETGFLPFGYAERFMKTLKSEEVHLSVYRTMADTQRRMPYFIENVYNHKRLHSTIGYCPPSEFEFLLELTSKSS